jgi:hypothetical protein
MSNNINLNRNNDLFFDSIMSIRYLKPKLIDNEVLNKMKKQYSDPIISKPLEPVIENNNFFTVEKIDKWYYKYYNQIYNYIYDNIKFILLLILLLLFLYYRYRVFRSKTNDEILIDTIKREEKRKQLIKKKILLEKLLKDNNYEVNYNNNIIEDNKTILYKKIDNELNINVPNKEILFKDKTQIQNDIFSDNQIMSINEMNKKSNIMNYSIDNYLSSTNLMAHNDINGNYDYI